MTPLHWACEHNHVDIVKILLRAGAKIEIKSKVRLIDRLFCVCVLMLASQLSCKGSKLKSDK